MKKRLIKIFIKFSIVMIGVIVCLYPNLYRAILQIDHFLHYEKLIDSKNERIIHIRNQIYANNPKSINPTTFVKIVEKYIEENITYRYDWITWGNMDYWPTAIEVLDAKQEDCDGQAILAASIIRSMGIQAEVIGNFQHVWVKVPKNQKQGIEKSISILRPQKETNFKSSSRNNSPKLPSIQINFPTWNVIKKSFYFYAFNFPISRQFLLLSICILAFYLPSKKIAYRPILINLFFTIIIYAFWVYLLKQDKNFLATIVFSLYVIILIITCFHKYKPNKTEK